MKIFIDRTACDCDLIIDEHIAEIRDGERVVVMDEDSVYEGFVVKRYGKNDPTWEWCGLKEVQKLNGQIDDISGLRYKKWDGPKLTKNGAIEEIARTICENGACDCFCTEGQRQTCKHYLKAEDIFETMENLNGSK